MMMAHVVDFRDPTLDYMADLGVAADLAANLRAFHYNESDLEKPVRNAEFQSLMRYQADRVHSYYQMAEPGLGLLDERGRFAVRRIEASGFDVFRRRPAMSRFWITARCAMGEGVADPLARRLWKGEGA